MLTNQDIDTLIEALDALQDKDKDRADSMLAGLFLVAMVPDPEEGRKLLVNIAKEGKQKSAKIAEKIIILKAKLIQMKDQNVVNDAADFLKNGGES